MITCDIRQPGWTALGVSPLPAGLGHTLGAALQQAMRIEHQDTPAARLDYTVRDMQFKGRGGFEHLQLRLRGADRQRGAAWLAASAARLAAMLAEWVPDTTEDPPAPERPHPVLARPIDDLALGVRSNSCLRQDGIVTVGDLIGHTECELLQLPHLGRRGLAEIKAALAGRGLLLRSRGGA